MTGIYACDVKIVSRGSKPVKFYSVAQSRQCGTAGLGLARMNLHRPACRTGRQKRVRKKLDFDVILSEAKNLSSI